MNLIFCHSKKSAKIAENAQIPNFGSISTHRKYFFLQKKIFPQFLYIKNHWKNTGTFDFENFCNLQPYLVSTETCSMIINYWAWICHNIFDLKDTFQQLETFLKGAGHVRGFLFDLVRYNIHDTTGYRSDTYFRLVSASSYQRHWNSFIYYYMFVFVTLHPGQPPYT